MTKRLRLSLEIGIVSAFLCWLAHRDGAGDFGWALHAARDLVAGRDPYDRPYGREAIPYPLPAAILGLPFVLLPDEVAGAVFFGLSSGLLAYGLTKESNIRLIVFLSYPYFAALQATQWTPLLMATAFYPVLLPVTLAKPNIGLPLGLTQTSKKGVVLCGGMLLASFALHPWWLSRWLVQLGEYQSFVPILTFPGILLVLAIWYYKEKTARLLLGFALIPQRWFYDPLPLWLIPKTVWELVAVTALSWFSYVGWMLLPRTIENTGLSSITFIYLPLLLVGVWQWLPSRKESVPGVC
jgi:hypothetical protein